MAGIDRYNDILKLFTPEKSVWSVPEVSAELGVPSSTVYRTMRELKRVQMLDAAKENHYRLGPAFIEFDRRSRLTDPLRRWGSELLVDLARHAGVPCVALLARLYSNTVLCVSDERSPGSTVESSYERGRPMPLIRGATSKMVLAQLPARRLSAVLATLAAPIDAISLQALRKELTRIRQDGFAIGHGEVDKELVGIAVPLLVPEEGLIASLSLVLAASDWNQHVERRLILMLLSSSAILRQKMEVAGPPPPR